MDPQACLERWRNAVLRGDVASARAARADLVRWLRGGGFWPVGLFPSERASLKRSGLTQRSGSAV